MPRDLVLVRHGQSEANIVQKRMKAEEGFTVPEGFFDRHDSEMLLTPKGIGQAAIAGVWLREAFPKGFDHYYVSSLTRTLQTAGNLALGGDWIIDDRLRERDWGEYAVLNDENQTDAYKATTKLKKQNKWYWCPPGGESLGTGVRLRWERLLSTMHREMDNDTFIGVTHGETIEVGRVILERLLIPEWIAQEKDEGYKLQNCQILHYSRVNPETCEDAGRLLWRRSICPWDETKSWNNGQWEQFDIDRTFDDAQLLAMADKHQPLFPSLASDSY